MWSDVNAGSSPRSSGPVRSSCPLVGYGAPRIHRELRAEGVRVGQKRIGRLMRQEGLAGTHRRRFRTTTVADESRRPAPDLVERNFTATAPNQLWVADFTYVRTWQGWLYRAVVVDVS